jgi:hypothetical protein
MKPNIYIQTGAKVSIHVAPVETPCLSLVFPPPQSFCPLVYKGYVNLGRTYVPLRFGYVP